MMDFHKAAKCIWHCDAAAGKIRRWRSVHPEMFYSIVIMLKRAWFQIHLSTAIVSMFVAATLIGANCHIRHFNEEFFYRQFRFSRAAGWPGLGVFYSPDGTVDWLLSSFILNFLAGLFILFPVACIFEIWTRRNFRLQRKTWIALFTTIFILVVLNLWPETVIYSGYGGLPEPATYFGWPFSFSMTWDSSQVPRTNGGIFGYSNLLDVKLWADLLVWILLLLGIATHFEREIAPVRCGNCGQAIKSKKASCEHCGKKPAQHAKAAEAE